MIERYTTESMGEIWSDQNKFKTWELVTEFVNSITGSSHPLN